MSHQFIECENEFHDVASTLALMAQISQSPLEEFAPWKWLVIMAHNALQGTCICYLQSTGGHGFNRKDVDKQILRREFQEPYASVERYPAPLKELLLRLPEPYHVEINNSKTRLSEPSDYLRWLCNWRDSFAHQAPAAYLIEQAIIRKAVVTALEKIHQLTGAEGYQVFPKFNEFHVEEKLLELRDNLSET